MTNLALEMERRLLAETETAARWCAERGFRGERSEPLPEGLSTRALHRINCDRTGFIARVWRVRRSVL